MLISTFLLAYAFAAGDTVFRFCPFVRLFLNVPVESRVCEAATSIVKDY